MKSLPTKPFFIIMLLSEFISSCGTIQSLKLANPDNKKGPISSRELAFRYPHYECKNPSEFLKVPYVYSGTKMDLRFIMLPYYCGWAGGEVAILNNAMFVLITPLVIIDVPLSFIADTLMLPVTIPKQYKEGNLIDPPYLKIGDIYRRNNDKKAAEYYEKGLKILPKYYSNRPYYEIYPYLSDLDDVLYWLANYYDKSDEFEKAVFYYEKLLEIDLRHGQGPSGPIERHYKELCKVYSKMGNHEKSSECYKKAYEYSPK